MCCRVWQRLSTPSCFCGGGRSRSCQYGSQYGFSVSSIRGGGCHRAGGDPVLSFPPHVQGGWGFLCCLLLKENKKPNERGLPSLRQNIVSMRFNPLSLGAPTPEKYDTCSIQWSNCWECSQHRLWGQPVHWSWQSLWADGCNNFALCGCHCFYPPNSPGR